MKIVTYNINGIRAATKFGLLEWIEKEDADIYCFQEVRANEDKTREIFKDELQQTLFFDKKESPLDKFQKIYNCGKIPGYAGTMILSKHSPSLIKHDMDEFWTDNEGRTTTIIFEAQKLAIVNAYIPNGNSRLEFKMRYLDALTKYLAKLKSQYLVICLGDFNIAHNEIDLTNPKECRNKSVFLPIEREAFGKLLNLGFVDCFRDLYPEEIAYSWRSYRSRMDNIPSSNKNFWKYRIDYIIYTKGKLKALDCMMPDLVYSDHLPVIANFEL